MSDKSPLQIVALNASLTALELYNRLRHLPYSLLLDSNQSQASGSRFDIICADPVEVILQKQSGQTRWFHEGQWRERAEDSLRVLQERLACYAPTSMTTLELPFTGGAMGFLSYDFGRQLVSLPDCCADDIGLPFACFGIYQWAVIRDNLRQQNYLVLRPECSDEYQHRLMSLLSAPAASASCSFKLLSDFESDLSLEAYAERFKRVQRYIRDGDCYQINLSRRFSAAYQGDVCQVYPALQSRTNAPFSALLEFDDYALLSFSPERFLRVAGGKVETKPIKGTRPRSQDPVQDRQNEQLLKNSSKDKAENLMIVDLLRNDLSKTCRLGTVQVPRLFDIEAYANVFHLVSTVTGTLREDTHPLELLRGCFPGGSITGAPKLRAMEIIESLETYRRNAYCGSILYVNFAGDMDSSIMIRTIICRHQQMYCWGGGGIVADSDMEEEYRESTVKVANLLNAVQQMSDKAELKYS